MKKAPFEVKYLTGEEWTSSFPIPADFTFQSWFSDSIKLITKSFSVTREALFINDLGTKLFRIFVGLNGPQVILFEATSDHGIAELLDCFKSQPRNNFFGPSLDFVAKFPLSIESITG